MDVSWFEGPPEGWDPLNGSPLVQADAEGRYVALVAPHGACMLNGREQNGCFPVPEAVDGYNYSMIGRTEFPDGTVLATANIGLGFGHPSPGLPLITARDAYGDTNARVAQVRYMDWNGSVIACGAVAPNAEPDRVLVANASALSGDWRWINELGGYRFIGSQHVNVPGYRPWQLGKPLADRLSIRACASGNDMESYWVPIVTADASAFERAYAWESGPVFVSDVEQTNNSVSGTINYGPKPIGTFRHEILVHPSGKTVIVPKSHTTPWQVTAAFMSHVAIAHKAVGRHVVL